MTYYYTEARLDQIKKELSLLKSDGRIEVANDLSDACEKGDLRESGEYEAAQRKQEELEIKIAALEKLVANARVLKESEIDLSRVSILSKVRVKNTKTGEIFILMLVSPGEAKPEQGIISVSSPWGKGLLGKKVGETAKFETPSGIIELNILEIGINLDD